MEDECIQHEGQHLTFHDPSGPILLGERTKPGPSVPADSDQTMDPDDMDIAMLCLAASAPRKRTVLSLETKLEIIKAVEKKKKLKSEIARDFGITGSTLTGIIKQKDQIMLACKSGTFSPARKRMRHGNYIAVEDALYNWVRKIQEKEFTKQIISGPVLRRKADDIAATLGMTGFTSSPGFIERFKKRKGIRLPTSSSLKKKESGALSDAGPSSDYQIADNCDVKNTRADTREYPTSYIPTVGTGRDNTSLLVDQEASPVDKDDEDTTFEIEFVFHEDGVGRYIQEGNPQLHNSCFLSPFIHICNLNILV